MRSKNLTEYLKDESTQVNWGTIISIPNPEEIKDLDVNPLVYNTNLKSLILRGRRYSSEDTTITAEIAQLIADILQNTNTLNTLNLDFDKIPSVEMRIIADALKNNITVTDLVMETAHIEDADFSYIMNVLQSNNYTLTSISFYESKHRSSSTLSEYLKNNQKIDKNVAETLKNIASGNIPGNPAKHVKALKLFKDSNIFTNRFNQKQKIKIEENLQESFFLFTGVCKRNPLFGDDTAGTVLPKYIWDEIFSYLKFSDVVQPLLSGDSGDAFALSGITGDVDVTGI